MILQIVGFKDSGKTTLMEETIRHLASQGYRIATIKHHGHSDEDVCIPTDVDSGKHYHAGAVQSIVQGHNHRITYTQTSSDDLSNIIDEAVTIDYDIILVEGFKAAPYDKVIIYRDEQEAEHLRKLQSVCYEIHRNTCYDTNAYLNWLERWLYKKGENK